MSTLYKLNKRQFFFLFKPKRKNLKKFVVLGALQFVVSEKNFNLIITQQRCHIILLS